MTSGRTTVTIYLVVFCGLILTALVLFAPWPLWLGFLLVVLVGALGWGLTIRRRRPEDPVSYIDPQPPAPPVEHRKYRITEVALPSAWDDYDFLFSATVRWLPIDAGMDESSVNAEAVAVEAILQRARKITETRTPGRASLVQHELSGALGWMETDGTGCLRAMAESVTLSLSEDDQGRLVKLASARKENTVWEHETRYEQTRREYLSANVLKDTGSAVVWWLAKNDDQVEKAVKDIGLLAQLSSAANNTHVPEPFQRFVPAVSYPTNGEAFVSAPAPVRTPADHFDAFLGAMDLGKTDPKRSLLSRRIADVLRKHGRQEVADELVRRFDASQPPLFDDFDPPGPSPDDQADQ